MKKLLVVGLISTFASAGAFAAACTGSGQATDIATPSQGTEQCVCNGNLAGKTNVNGGSGAVVASAVFIKNGFIAQCSANTYVSYNEVATTAFAVAGGSKKGNQTVIGSSNGGSVTTDQACPTTGCTPTEISAANARATTAASGS